MAQGPITYCPPTDGTIKGCQANCQCVYQGQQSQLAQCMSQCVQSGGGVSVGVDTQAVQQSLAGAVIAALQAMIAPLLQAATTFLVHIGLFLLAIAFVVIGFMVLASHEGTQQA